MSKSTNSRIPVRGAILPVASLLTAVVTILIVMGPDFVAGYSYLLLLGASFIALVVARLFGCCHISDLKRGLTASARQTVPAVPILLLIGTVSATWMLSGVVPMLIKTGIDYIDPGIFLPLSCCICAFISLLTGSSWTTIATIGVAFMGIGSMMGYSPGWIAGAIISGAYFGDKISPLSDTTVLAATSTRVNLFTHIRYMLITTVPSMIIALTVFTLAGSLLNLTEVSSRSGMTEALGNAFNFNPWIMAIPALTMLLIILRTNTFLTLILSTLLGLAGIFIFQPHILASSGVSPLTAALRTLLSDTSVATGDPALDTLVATGGMKGMLPTVWLVLSAMMFGGVMIGTGMLASITDSLDKRLRNRISAIGATVSSGLFLNSATADQYLSIIIGANMYGDLYRRLGLEERLLSRTLEDSVSVTSVLIPWNSCGVTQSSVLGVSTLAYLPYCVFNYLSPLMSLVIAFTGFKIKETAITRAARPDPIRIH